MRASELCNYLYRFCSCIVSERGYTYYKLRGCDGRNELFLGLVGTREVCRSKCDDKTECISFEWYGELNPHPTLGQNFCKLSSSCTYDLSVVSLLRDPTDLYVKGNNLQPKS